ncbi:hotdog family protein [Vibrio sp. VB16]|uniref:hotdog family protein n=1 Tax=Vibrio sp. VB16 TaxID=2785746 RepID=UPI00189DAA8A|nr:hotdog family protein [Vibrio sp. VB16]UGA54095.1 hotdog family protein [Vibrio sp. VB16]
MSNYPSIETLIPHASPMIFIDEAIAIETESIHCRVTVKATNLFFNQESNAIPAYVGIEFMAQSISAWSGYHAGLKGQASPIGFLLGSRRYHVSVEQFLEGSVLDIYAHQIMENNGMAVFSGRIEHKGDEIAQCQLNVYVPSKEKLQEMKTKDRK